MVEESLARPLQRNREGTVALQSPPAVETTLTGCLVLTRGCESAEVAQRLPETQGGGPWAKLAPHLAVGREPKVAS